jgi:hypothetical protein
LLQRERHRRRKGGGEEHWQQRTSSRHEASRSLFFRLKAEATMINTTCPRAAFSGGTSTAHSSTGR